ncbi:AAA+-type ATPase [Exophiala oligosperma]
MSTFIVRPSNSDKDPFRVRLTAVSMLSLKLKPGDICELRKIDDSDTGRKKLAIAWEASGAGMKDTVVQTSKLLQEVFSFKLSDRITIGRSSRSIQDASTIVLQCYDGELNEAEAQDYSVYAKLTLRGKDAFLVLDQKILFQLGDHDRGFIVKDISINDDMIARVTQRTRFQITNADSSPGSIQGPKIEFQAKSMGGLDKEIRQIQDIVQDLCSPSEKDHLPAYEPIQGILLYGAKGTGKTELISLLASAEWSTVTYWEPGTQIQISTQPQLVIIRPEYLLQNVAGSVSVTGKLDNLFQRIRGSPTLIVGEARHPNDINQSLRSAKRLGCEIELPIPSAIQRKEILQAFHEGASALNDNILQEMADRTHGYVGDDLYALMRQTIKLTYDRLGLRELSLQDIPDTNGAVSDDTLSKPKGPIVTLEDLTEAFKYVRPSALQEIFLEKPKVRWSDIGGQHSTKRQLQNAVQRPLKQASRMAEFGLHPKKGLLLYGPPGCSKTLLVRALATEAGTNFLAVKGAELISMYVGESERATREVFRKARAASPSIIFFDEIDAIASRGRHGSDLNVLTTLLNEMDGFEELRNVFVVGATNKPENIDPALMRPGRFDNVVYIGPPDYEARIEIFHKRLSVIQYRPDTDLAEEVEEFAKATEGFSGAEVVAICQEAGEVAFDTDRDSIIADDVRVAIKTTPKSITKEMINQYERWNAARMR